MSRSNVSDTQFVIGMGARGALVATLALAIVYTIRRMWDSIEFELGGLPNFQRRP